MKRSEPAHASGVGVRRRADTRVVRGEVDGSRWEMAHRAPAPALRPHVLRLCGYEEWAPSPRRQRQFPGPTVVMIVELGRPLRVSLGGGDDRAVCHPGGFAAGLGGIFSDTAHAGHQCGVQIDLTPTGARRLFGVPMSELADRVIALRDLQPETHRHLAEELAERPDWASRLDRVEELLIARLLEAAIDTRRVDWALARIVASGGLLEVGGLARALGLSRKHLTTLFRDQVGVPPKQVARLVRFEGLMRAAAEGRALRWAELAIDHGYADQAHLARDVRSFTGLTPTEARARIPGLLDLLS